MPFPLVFLHFLVRQLFSQVCHDVTQFGGGDETIAVLVKDLEGLEDFLLGIRVLHLARHHGQKFGEINGATTVGINLY